MKRYRYTGDLTLTYTSYREVYEDKNGVQQHRALVGDPERDEALMIEPVLDEDAVPPNDGRWEEEPEKKAPSKGENKTKE